MRPIVQISLDEIDSDTALWMICQAAHAKGQEVRQS